MTLPVKPIKRRDSTRNAGLIDNQKTVRCIRNNIVGGQREQIDEVTDVGSATHVHDIGTNDINKRSRGVARRSRIPLVGLTEASSNCAFSGTGACDGTAAGGSA
jgi:hypothetical protein